MHLHTKRHERFSGTRWLLCAGLLLWAAPAPVSAQADADDAPCGIAPRAKPKRIKGGEGVPPLPLPATPLRRSERKRDPAPPLLIGKVRWGRSNLVWKLPDGREKPYADWNHDPNDVHRLLESVTGALKTKYRPEEVELASFAANPEELPILYASGLKPFALEPHERKNLSTYLQHGGFFFAVAHHGSKAFSDSVRAEAAKLFPDRPFRLLPPDHPIYRTHRRLDRVRYSSGTKDRPQEAPYLEGLYIGCRVAMVLSPYDLCCEWDSNHLPDKFPGVKGDDAFALGLNIVSYAMAYYPLGKFYGRWGLAELEDPQVNEGDFVFAQVRHSGHFDPNPTAFAALLETVMTETSVKARFKRRMVTLDSPKLGEHPFLYLTGHDDVRFSAKERSGLRRFLLAGGVLLADSCCGNISFDSSFRRELVRVLPGHELRPLPPEHAFFSSFYEVRGVRYTTAVRASFPDLATPFIEGVEIDGSLRVIYSRFDLGNGWEGEDHPFASGYDRDDARRIGVNAVIYTLTN